MTDILRQKGFHVRRDTVMELMREVNPTGTALRRSRKLRRRVYRSYGPNHTWHIDGYDKLKPFGFPIHGCIDGYSRKILWLNVGPSNNDPSITAYYFASCIAENKGCPQVLQSDPGTENTISGAIQCTLRNGGTDYFSGENSYRITFSKLNQKLGGVFSEDKKVNGGLDLEQFGAFMRENQHDKRCIRFCFMPVLQKVLDDLKDRWNNHHIAYSRYAAFSNGRPVVLYSVPELNGGNDCIQKLEDDDLNFAFQQCTPPSTSGSSQFDHSATIEFNRIGFSKAQHWQEALQQYFYLREHFQFQEI